MRHDWLPAHCDGLMEQREALRQAIREAALAQLAIESAATTELYLHGQVTAATSDARNQAGWQYHQAICAMLDSNAELHHATT
jgi:hypothetical protein